MAVKENESLKNSDEKGRKRENADFLGRDSFNKELISNSEKIKFKWRKPGRMKI